MSRGVSPLIRERENIQLYFLQSMGAKHLIRNQQNHRLKCIHSESGQLQFVVIYPVVN